MIPLALVTVIILAVQSVCVRYVLPCLASDADLGAVFAGTTNTTHLNTYFRFYLSNISSCITFATAQ